MYLDRLRLDGRVAFVTGGAQGIGWCIADAPAEAGAVVTIADLDGTALATAREAFVNIGSMSGVIVNRPQGQAH